MIEKHLAHALLSALLSQRERNAIVFKTACKHGSHLGIRINMAIADKGIIMNFLQKIPSFFISLSRIQDRISNLGIYLRRRKPEVIVRKTLLSPYV
ncbi:hypothetical protein SDC9_162798 [bioreactor metagenome]|uniref:Uncharacterized protein n=1 Tax=bioreactor metagenome TaxID=1076179 RepID=A0A645FTW6_9ZZZZ